MATPGQAQQGWGAASFSPVQRGQPGCLTCPVPCRFFYQFLLGNERATAKEIRDEYVETLSKIYLSYYRSYVGRLMKVQVSQAGVGVERPISRGEDP